MDYSGFQWIKMDLSKLYLQSKWWSCQKAWWEPCENQTQSTVKEKDLKKWLD